MYICLFIYIYIHELVSISLFHAIFIFITFPFDMKHLFHRK